MVPWILVISSMIIPRDSGEVGLVSQRVVRSDGQKAVLSGWPCCAWRGGMIEG